MKYPRFDKGAYVLGPLSSIGLLASSLPYRFSETLSRRWIYVPVNNSSIFLQAVIFRKESRYFLRAPLCYGSGAFSPAFLSFFSFSLYFLSLFFYFFLNILNANLLSFFSLNFACS